MKNHLGKSILIVFTFLILVVVLILNSSSLTTAQEIEDESEFDYSEGSSKGPARWGDLKQEWATCKTGKLQSPIDLVDEMVNIVPKLGKIKKYYKPANATLKNRGHDISLQWVSGAAGSIQINGTDYALQQLHWHSPSEHAINGKRFALEMHMVHMNVELNKIAVIGVLYNDLFPGAPNPFISRLEKGIQKIADTHNEVNVGMVDPTHINTGGKKYYRYLGSLTTPPCREGIIWTINDQLAPVSKAQVKLLRTAVHDFAENNARPLQSLNDRNILFYSPMYIELPTSSSDVEVITLPTTSSEVEVM